MSTGTIDTAERELIASGLKKLQAKQKLSAREAAAVKRFERGREEERRWSYYRTIPQKHWREMSGRQAKVLIEQAEAYGLPFGGAVVDLPALAKALHDFLAANKFKLARELTDEELIAGGGESTPGLERLRNATATLREMDVEERKKTHADLGDLHNVLMRFTSLLRRGGEILQRKFGGDAADIYNSAIDQAERELLRDIELAIRADSSSAGADQPALQTGIGTPALPDGPVGARQTPTNDPPVRRGRNRPADRPASR